VEQAAQKFTKLGATVKTISIPWHREGIHPLRPWNLCARLREAYVATWP